VQPDGVVLDSSGNLYIADMGNSRIRRLCIKKKLLPSFSEPRPGFDVRVGVPTTINIDLRDECGNTVHGASVIVTFSNGDVPAQLRESGDGVYLGVWTPGSRTSPLSLRVTAQDPTGNVKGEAVIASTGAITSPALTGGAETQASVGVRFQTTFTAGGGSPPYRWTAAVLPPGLTFSIAADGLSSSVSGTPTVAGSFSYTIGVTDSAGNSVSVIRFLIILAGVVVNSPEITAVTDAASFRTTGIAPGSLLSIFGRNLATTTAAQVALPVPTQLEGTRVLFGNQDAPVLFVSPGQVNIQAPHELQAGTSVNVAVVTGGGSSAPTMVSVVAARPEVFVIDGMLGGRAAALRADGTVATAANSVTRGEIVSIYCTGFGSVTPKTATGAVATAAAPADNPVFVQVGGLSAQVLYAGVAPGFVGLFQVNALVPLNAPTGDSVPVSLSAAGQTGTAVKLAIR